MANNNKATNPNVEMVDLYIERGAPNDDPNLYVGFNGVNYILPKGKTSKVPKYVYDEVMRSRKAQENLDKKVDEMLEAASEVPK